MWDKYGFEELPEDSFEEKVMENANIGLWIDKNGNEHEIRNLSQDYKIKIINFLKKKKIKVPYQFFIKFENLF